MNAPLKTDVQVEVIKVIRVYFLRGEGKTEGDPVRECLAYFDDTGKFLFEFDPVGDS